MKGDSTSAVAEQSNGWTKPHELATKDGSEQLEMFTNDVPFSLMMRYQLRQKLRSFKLFRNKLNSILWPGSVLNLSMTVGGVTAVRLSHVTFLEPIKNKMLSLESVLPFSDSVLSIGCACSMYGLLLFLGITIFRRMILRNLLAYRAWMYEPPNHQSMTTKVWGLLVRMLSGWAPSLYSYQASLPRLPVPPLSETVSKLIASLEPVYAGQPEKLKELKEEAEQFEKGVGPKLQRALVLRSWWADNFVSDWWEQYVYLMGRSPLTINSNYYIMDQCYWTPTKLQCARAAGVLYQMLLVREDILTEEFEPLSMRKTIPVCMAQYRRVFSTTRVPGEEIDTLKHYHSNDSQHIVVNSYGLLYKVDITDSCGQLVCPSRMEKQFEWILQDSQARAGSVSDSEKLVPALTSTDRTTWAKARTEFFSSGVNKETLHWVESAVLYVVLDPHSFSELSTRASHLLHGEPGQYWFDKSIQLIVMSDGHMGLNCEHSFADAPVVAHVLEYDMTFDVTKELYDADGHCHDLDAVTTPVKLRSKPTPLLWEVDEKLASVISRACSQAEKNISDLDLVLYDNDEFGKGAIKTCKLSPDAFIQMSLHTTYRKLTGVPVLTYEASMTRLYKQGRTETVRSLSKEANDFVVAFLDPSCPVEKKRSLLKAACEKHVTMYKDAMNAKGLDRHLFALYVASRGLGIDCDFLKKVLSIPWTLSTSQQPQQQIWWSPGCSDPKFHNQLSPGGGFGPVAADGYGVSYMVAGERRIFFHVSSLKSGPGTNSQLFQDTLRTTMVELKNLHSA